MEGEGEGLGKTERAARAAERRSGSDRRTSTHRRQADRKSAGSASEAPAGPSDAEPLDKEPKIVRKFYFRSFEDRRLGIDRRALPDADDERLTADEVASLMRQKN